MPRRLLITLLVWFLVVVITVPLLVVLDVLDPGAGDPLRLVIGASFLVLAAVCAHLGLFPRAGDRRSSAFLAFAAFIALLGIVIAGWLPVSPEAMENLSIAPRPWTP